MGTWLIERWQPHRQGIKIPFTHPNFIIDEVNRENKQPLGASIKDEYQGDCRRKDMKIYITEDQF